MRFLVKAEVSLKRGHFDPEGDVAAKSLKDLGFSVGTVRVSKAYTIEVDARDPTEAKALVEDMCRKLLANPTKDDFRVEVLVIEGRSS
ncbi:MAG: phosphoribosylformylglycinamidine synthase subunit PurS [Candidatus Methanosuratincola petrocarbonis]